MNNYSRIDVHSTEERTVGIDVYSTEENNVANNNEENTVAVSNETSRYTATSKPQKSKVRIGHLNVRSLKTRNHLVQLRSLVQENELDVLAVSESLLNSSVKNAEVEIQRYKISRLDKQTKIGGVYSIYERASFKTMLLKGLQVQHMEIFVLGEP